MKREHCIDNEQEMSEEEKGQVLIFAFIIISVLVFSNLSLKAILMVKHTSAFTTRSIYICVYFFYFSFLSQCTPGVADVIDVTQVTDQRS